MPSATLVNSRTAGEAELFAGVLQDFGKTVVVGTVTAGKNTVQELVPIESDKSAIRITVGTLSLVQSGSSWQDTGIQPGRTVEMPEEGRAVLEGSAHTSTTAPADPTDPATGPSGTDVTEPPASEE